MQKGKKTNKSINGKVHIGLHSLCQAVRSELFLKVFFFYELFLKVESTHVGELDRIVHRKSMLLIDK